MVTLEPGKGHDVHNRPGVEEILYVLEGKGLQMVDVEGTHDNLESAVARAADQEGDGGSAEKRTRETVTILDAGKLGLSKDKKYAVRDLLGKAEPSEIAADGSFSLEVGFDYPFGVLVEPA